MAGTDFRGRSSEEIEREARRTRAQLAETMEQIQARLSPANWQAMLRDGALVMEIVRRHPMPSLLLGVSALWLAASLARDPLFRPRHRREVEPLPHDRAPVPVHDSAQPPHRSAAAATPYPEDVTVAAPAERALDDEVAARRAAAAGHTGTAL